MTFPFKQHRVAVVIYFLSIFALLAVGALLVFTTLWQQAMTLGLSLIGIALLLAVVTYPQRIVVEKGEVMVRSGLWTMLRIRLSDVSRIYASKGWPASHTLYPVTGWRFSVGTRRKDMLVIPADEMGFLEEVARQAPHLHRYGNELRATPEPTPVTPNLPN